METQKIQKESVKTSGDPFSKELVEKIISSAMEVHSQLGPGLLEILYEEAMAHEFALRKLPFVRQKEIRLTYKGKDIGWHRVDFLVENEVLIELKSVQVLHGIHEAQMMACLKALQARAGLLINFNVERLQDGIRKIVS
ncbi:MAG: GxxExxY protein [Syntrophaceae bacterium]|nr:GxxExxY protein [Syntrophaceae bacterium]